MQTIHSAICSALWEVPSQKVWELSLERMKPGAHLLVFNSILNHHRNTINIEDSGFEIRDTILWAYGETSGPNVTDSTLTPHVQAITVARKPLSGTVAANVLEHGTGAINIKACRVQAQDNPAKWNTPRGGFWSTDPNADSPLVENKEGRWPANFCHDGSDEVVSLFPLANSSRANGNPNNPKRGVNHTATSYGKGDGKTTHDYRDTGSAARYFYSASSFVDLVEYLCRLITPEGGTITDPLNSIPWLEQVAARNGFTLAN